VLLQAWKEDPAVPKVALDNAGQMLQVMCEFDRRIPHGFSSNGFLGVADPESFGDKPR